MPVLNILQFNVLRVAVPPMLMRQNLIIRVIVWVDLRETQYLATNPDVMHVDVPIYEVFPVLVEELLQVLVDEFLQVDTDGALVLDNNMGYRTFIKIPVHR